MRDKLSIDFLVPIDGKAQTTIIAAHLIHHSIGKDRTQVDVYSEFYIFNCFYSRIGSKKNVDDK